MNFNLLEDVLFERSLPGGEEAPDAGKAAMPKGKMAKAEKPDRYAAPELPKNTDPFSVHQYYMAMADHHDQHAEKHRRLRGLQKLWSDSRNFHDDRHLYHKALRDGFAQKALGVSIEAPADPGNGTMSIGGGGAAGGGQKKRKEAAASAAGRPMFEELEENCKCPRCGSGDTHGVSGLQAERCHNCGHQFKETVEAFGGSSPTGALATAVANKAPNLKVLQPKPQPVSRPMSTAPKFGTSKVREAIAEAQYGSIDKVLRKLLA